MVGVGCGDDTPDRIIQEVRTLVEQDGAEVVIGPLSGDEAIAIANYAKDHPDVTFINGIAGVAGPDAAGAGSQLLPLPRRRRAVERRSRRPSCTTTAGWDTVAVIADDYSFGWTSAAGFIADFCAVGGEVVARVFPPLGTTDYSSFIQQLPDPDEVDGYFWVVGGTGHRRRRSRRSSTPRATSPATSTPATCSSTRRWRPRSGRTSPAPTSVASPRSRATCTRRRSTTYLASADAAWDTLVGGTHRQRAGRAVADAPAFGFVYGYYVAGTALVQALNAVNGDLSDGHAALREALSSMTLEAPYGNVTLDENRQGIIDTYVAPARPRRGER